MDIYLAIYTNAAGNDLGSHTFPAADRLSACDIGWSYAPEGTDDFELFDEVQYLELTGATLSA